MLRLKPSTISDARPLDTLSRLAEETNPKMKSRDREGAIEAPFAPTWEIPKLTMIGSSQVNGGTNSIFEDSAGDGPAHDASR